MARDGKVNWYADDVILAVDGASDEILTCSAFQAEGYAKTEAPVDTGFMRNAIYGLGPNGSHRAGVQATADRGAARRPQLAEHEAALHGAALYTIFQETRVGFMYGAVEAVKRIVGGVIETVGREQMND